MWLILVSLVSVVYVHIAATRAGLGRKRWTLLALLVGPVALLPFHQQKRLLWRKQQGPLRSRFWA